MNKEKSIAVIPARGNSKGIPRKNLQPIGGLPLMAHAILAAREAECFDRIIVSTEDSQFAEVAKSYGAEVPFLRPSRFAGDQESAATAVNHLLKELAKESYHPSFCAVLYPTHPFRNPELIAELVAKGLSGFSPVTAVREIIVNKDSLVRLDENDSLVPIRPSADAADEERWYRPHGYFSGFRPGMASNPYIHVLKNPIEWIDIDTWEDLALAEEVAQLQRTTSALNPQARENVCLSMC